MHDFMILLGVFHQPLLELHGYKSYLNKRASHRNIAQLPFFLSNLISLLVKYKPYFE